MTSKARAILTLEEDKVATRRHEDITNIKG